MLSIDNFTFEVGSHYWERKIKRHVGRPPIIVVRENGGVENRAHCPSWRQRSNPGQDP